VKAAAAAKVASSDSTPDQNFESEHQAEPNQDHPVEEEPWSEWQWCEEGQMCYRGRKDLKGEWEYDLAPLPKEKERLYTPLREEPIEYSIEELRIIWQPKTFDLPNGSLETVTPASTNDPPKKTAVVVKKPKAVIEEDSSEEEIEKNSEAEEKESTVTSIVTSTKGSEKHEKPQRSRKQRPVEKRGRQLERGHFSHKEKVDKWRKAVE